jgi:uncharacterized protein YhbP (UPF0306 family)
MAIERSKRRIAAGRIATTARRLLDASALCAIATVAPDGRAHLNTAYFAWSLEFELVWMSDPGAKHSRNIRTNDTIAIAVYDSTQTWGEPDRGIQLFGSARQAERADAEDAEAIYAKRFADYRQTDFDAYRFYLFRPRRLKLFDERDLGAGMFVTARVGGAGRLAWERTEVYRSAP